MQPLTVSGVEMRVVEQDRALQDQNQRLEQLDTVSSDLRSREQQSREDQRQLDGLRRSLSQLSDREREVRGSGTSGQRRSSAAEIQDLLCL